jgi:hypothetical protein
MFIEPQLSAGELLPKVKLVPHQAVITTATIHELIVRAHFNYLAPVY